MVTPCTRTVVDVAIGELAMDWITDANCCPFCRSSVFFDAGVLPLKKVSQFALIAAVADPPPEVEGPGLELPQDAPRTDIPVTNTNRSAERRMALTPSSSADDSADSVRRRRPLG